MTERVVFHDVRRRAAFSLIHTGAEPTGQTGIGSTTRKGCQLFSLNSCRNVFYTESENIIEEKNSMRLLPSLACMFAITLSATAQGTFQDIMSGALINPEAGVYSWYELKDAKDGRKLFVRQAIVGEKEVAGKKGYYLETEVTPEIGFPIVYKMLLTGPATDKANVHEIIVKDGFQPPEKIALDTLDNPPPDSPETVRTSMGMETVTTPAGELQAEHFTITQGDNKTEVWINDTVRPMGIVKLISSDGELLLSRSGTGGEDGQSALDRKAPEGEPADVTVRVESAPKKNYSGKKNN